MKRLKKVLIRSGIALAVLVAILLVLNAYYVWTTGARLEEQITALRAAGEPVFLEDLARAPIPPEENAATYLRRAQDSIAALEKDLDSWHEYWYRRGLYNIGPPTATEQKQLAEALDAYPQVFLLLQKAAACPDYDPQPDFTLPPAVFLSSVLDPLQRNRSVAEVLKASAIFHLYRGERDEALRQAILGLRLARHFDRIPMIPGYLTAIACRGAAMDAVNRVLQAGPVSKPVRDALDAELARHDRMEGYQEALKAERAYAMSFLTSVGRGFWFWPLRGFRDDGMCYFLEVMYEDMSTASSPCYEARPQWAAAPAKSRIPFSFRALVDLLRPALDAVREAVNRTRAKGRSLRVLNAIQARVPPESKEAPKLSDLGLPPVAITDPYSGKPLRVKRLPSGWVVYAVGTDLKDDGGKVDQKTDVGFGPPEADATPGKE